MSAEQPVSVPADRPPLEPALEALLMVADQPVDHLTLARAVRHPPAAVLAALDRLAERYREGDHGFELRHIAGGWRFYTREDLAEVVQGFVTDAQQARLTTAALETLAVVAYQQPVSRGRVSAVRGVNVDAVMRTLVARGLVAEAGTEEGTGAVLYRTTPYFLERLGLAGLDDLPDLAPYLPELAELREHVDVRPAGRQVEAGAPAGTDAEVGVGAEAAADGGGEAG